MKKPVRRAISIVITNNLDETLFAKRSAKKKSYPLTWSLPSHFMEEGESPEDTIHRIGTGKLGVELEVGRLLNEGGADRGSYTLFMSDYEAGITKGEPAIVSDDYIELKWADAKQQLATMQSMGSCCRLYKEFLEGA